MIKVTNKIWFRALKATCEISNQIFCTVLSNCQSLTLSSKHLHYLNTCSAPHIFLQQGQYASLLSGPHHAVSHPSPSSLHAFHVSSTWTHLVERRGYDVERRRLGVRPILQPDTYECWRSSWIWSAWYHPPTSTWTSGRTLGPDFPYNHYNDYNHSPNYYKVCWCHWTGTSLLNWFPLFCQIYISLWFLFHTVPWLKRIS